MGNQIYKSNAIIISQEIYDNQNKRIKLPNYSTGTLYIHVSEKKYPGLKYIVFVSLHGIIHTSPGIIEYIPEKQEISIFTRNNNYFKFRIIKKHQFLN